MTLAAGTRSIPIRESWCDRHRRWLILGTLFLATFLNYLDRQTLSNAADPVAREFGLTLEQRGRLLATFVYFYAAAHLFVGPLLDHVRSVRWLFPVFVVGWSICNLLIGFAHEYATVLWLRALLGLFESANFPLCLMLVARLFPARERVLAVGIFTSGSVIATLVAPKLVIYFATVHSWRWAFIFTGALGLLWLVPWFLLYRDPPRETGTAGVAAPAESGEFAFAVLRRPVFWGVVLSGIGLIPSLYFLSQWLPSYLTQAWKVPYDQALGDRLILVSIAQDIGIVCGGWVVMSLAKRGWTLHRSRRLVISVAYVMMMSILALRIAPSINVGVALLCVFAGGLGLWLVNHSAFKQEVARGRVATVSAWVGFAETGASAFLVDRVGRIAQATGGFGAVFAVFAVMLTFALGVAFWLLRPRGLQPP
jgi:ACS family hexuronate transporter-like MFS transporter